MKKILLIIVMLFVFSYLLVKNDTSSESISINPSTTESVNGHIVEYAGDAPLEIYNKCLSLNKGRYQGILRYTVSEPNSQFIITDNGTIIDSFDLSTENTLLDYQFDLSKVSSDVNYSIQYSGAGYLCIDEITIDPFQKLYNDVYFYVVLIWIFAAIGFFLSYIYRQQIIGESLFKTLTLLIMLSIISSIPFFSTNFAFGGDDLHYHLSRIEGIKNGLVSGQFPVIIFPDALNGNGYLNSMYPSLFLYLPAILRIVGVSYVLSYKVLLVFMQMATVFSMGFSINKFKGSKITIILGCVMYSLLRYRLGNIFVRAAIGETLAFIFFPLVITGLYLILHSQKHGLPYFVIGMSGILQSHILSFIIFVIISVIVVTIYWKKVIQKSVLLTFIQSGLAIILLNLWFITPFLYYYKSNYINPGILKADYVSSSLKLSYLFGLGISDTSPRPHSLGISLVIGIFLIIFYLIIHNMTGDKENYFKHVFFIACIMLLMSSTISKLFSNIVPIHSFYSFLQFPWRLVGPAALLIILSGCVIIGSDNINEPAKLLIASFLIVLTLSDMSVWQNKQVIESIGYEAGMPDQSHYDKILSDRSLTAQYPIEWRPVNSFNNDSLSADYIISDPSVINLIEYKKGLGSLQFNYEGSKDTFIDLPLINYNCYRVIEDSQSILTMQDDGNGRIRLLLKGDHMKHTVKVQYHFPIIFLISNIISILFIICYNLNMFKNHIKRRNHG